MVFEYSVISITVRAQYISSSPNCMIDAPVLWQYLYTEHEIKIQLRIHNVVNHFSYSGAYELTSGYINHSPYLIDQDVVIFACNWKIVSTKQDNQFSLEQESGQLGINGLADTILNACE